MKHLTSAHNESRAKTVPCPQCDTMCYDQENLRKHMAKHSGEASFYPLVTNALISVEGARIHLVGIRGGSPR